MTRGNMQMRVVSVALLVGIFFIVLTGRLWQLQVLTGDDLSRSAQATQTHTVKIPAQRGVIYDRDGEVLANNVPGLNVTVIPSAISREKVEELANTLGADTDEVLGRYDAAVLNNPYASMLVKENADRNDITYVSERTERFPGVAVNDDHIRNYPGGPLAAHVLGFTGSVTEAELGVEPFKELAHDAVVGKSGVELHYEKLLRGKAGSEEYTVDALGRVVTLRRADGSRADGGAEVSPELGRPDRVTDPVPGKNLKLTVDMDLQKVAEKELDAALERARDSGYTATGGAVIAMDPRNGQILAMTSWPNFDPQLFVGGISGAEEVETYEHLNSEEANAPFANRAIYGTYPAASTFKVFTGMAGLYYGVINPSTTVTDNGACWLPAGVSSGCWQSWRENGGYGVHGTQNYAEALEDSNNKFFYQVADWIWNSGADVDLLPKFYEKFGFGSKTGIDLPGEEAGRVPTSAWQQEFGETPDEKYWGVGRWVNMSIGQGDLAVTPLQLARGYAAIQNGGTLVTPHVGMEVRNQNGDLVEKISPDAAGTVDVDPGIFGATTEGLRMVTGEGGTAEGVFYDSELQVAGKSGTGEMWGSDAINWFIGWAENKDQPLLVLTMIEGGGVFETGSEMTAGPVVRHMLEAYYGVEQSPKDKYRTARPKENPPEDSRQAPGPTRRPAAPAAGAAGDVPPG